MTLEWVVACQSVAIAVLVIWNAVLHGRQEILGLYVRDIERKQEEANR